MANEYCINWKKMEVNQNNEGTRVHPLVALAFSVMIGGVFVIFLPFIGLYMFFKHVIFNQMRKGVQNLAHAVAAPVAAPGTSYLTGDKPGEQKIDSLEQLSKDINSQR